MSIELHATGLGHGRLMNDLTGRRFGRLVALHGRRHNGATRWECRCDCGNTTLVIYTNLTRGRTSSCGCLLRESKTTHGMTRTKEYRAWSNMFARCYCESHVSFPRYGGRGITVCKRWESFENFIADMGPAPSKLHTLDRIKNGRGYYKSNCRWTTIAVQSANKRKRR